MCSRGLVAMTLPSHGRDRGFDPHRERIIIYLLFLVCYMVQNPPQHSSQPTSVRPNTGSGVAGIRPPQAVNNTNNNRRDVKSSDQQNVVYINDKIKAFEVIVITEDGENLGKMKRFDALALAQEQ